MCSGIHNKELKLKIKYKQEYNLNIKEYISVKWGNLQRNINFIDVQNVVIVYAWCEESIFQ